MEWENKAEMIRLGNSPDTKEAFQNYVLEHVETFDGQAWDMFSNLVSIIIEEMKPDIEFWSKIWPHLKSVDCNDEKFGLRSGFRIALLQTICEDELKLT